MTEKTTNFDLSNSGRGVWLVKVPKYIEKKFKNADSNMDVAVLKIIRAPGAKAKVSLSLSDELMSLKTGENEEIIPKNHVLDVSVVTKQTLGVFSHVSSSAASESSSSSKDKETNNNNTETTDSLYMEGRIVQKLECRPIADACYMKLKLESIRKASEPQRKVKPLEKIVHNFKPVKDHAHNIDYRQRKKAEGKKARDDKNYVMDILFNAFEKHQYYNIKDLVKITKQPIGYLKEILKEVCDYNMKNPHKNMWELKKEYRHYKPQEEKKEKNDRIDDEESGSD